MPEKVKGIEGIKYLMETQDGVARLLEEVRKVEDKNVKSCLLRLYDVIVSLWMYWNDSGDEIAERDIQYYQAKFFDILSRAKRNGET